MGDIHGNLSAYKQCMERSLFDKELDKLIQLGDVSDRRPHSAEVVEELLKIPSLTALRGNHDVWTMDWLIHGITDMSWIENGGFVTVRSYEQNRNRIDIEKHKEFFLSTQLDFFIDSEKRVFVHGGFTNPKGPIYEENPSICYWDRSLWRDALNSLKSTTSQNFKEVYLGHTPTLNWGRDTPMNAQNIWNLDTGAGTNGKLTIMDIDTKEYWQSD